MNEVDTSLPTPEIPPKREGHSRSSSAAFSSSETSDPSRWSFPASLYRNSAIIEMGEAFPMEIGGSEDMQEVSLNQANRSNRNSASSFSTSLPLPWQENVSHGNVPSGNLPVSGVFGGPLYPPPPAISASYTHKLATGAPISRGSAGTQAAPVATTTGNLGTEEAPLTPPSRIPEGTHQRTHSDVYVSAQESVEDLEKPTRRTNRTAKSPLQPSNNSPGSTSSGNASGNTRISPSEMRKSENLRKLQRIINSEDDEDASMDVENLSYVTAFDTPATHADRESRASDKEIQTTSLKISNNDSGGTKPASISAPISIRGVPEFPVTIRQPSGPRPEPPNNKGTSDRSNRSSRPPNSPAPKPQQSAFEHDQGSPHGVPQGSPQTPSQHKFPERRSSRRRRLDISGLALKSNANPLIDRVSQAESGHARSPSSPERSQGAAKYKEFSHSHSQSVPDAHEQHHKNYNKTKQKRNFTKKSLENMMEQNPSPYDIADIGLPRPERLLLEKFIDSLSKLSIEVQMDGGKREEGRRRLNNALRALEGWF